MLRYFDSEYEDPLGAILGDNPEFKEANAQFLAKSDELCKMIGGVGSPAWGLFEDAIDEYHRMGLILSKAMYLQGAADRERMLK